VPEERRDDTISPAELSTRLGELVVADARTADRWRGESNEIDRVPGRIPGALSAPWDEPLPELPPGELVSYCGSGVTAAVLLHRLHLVGRDGLLYPGSWSEWEQHPELPVSRGD
jgi:thiosulfate/3-mercaptopyruvate sulfurtransferase